MKAKFIIMSLALLMSMPLFARQRDTVIVGDGFHYVGKWPEGKGVLYSQKDGLVMGDFKKARPQGECVCYMPSGVLYWGQYNKSKATGYGRLYRENGIIFTGNFKNGKFHGVDTLFRRDGSVYVGEFKNGRLKKTIANLDPAPAEVAARKPEYPRVDHKDRHMEFLKMLELDREERKAAVRAKAGLINPKFQGGTLSDFTLWVNSQIDYDSIEKMPEGIRTVVVEFVVGKDGSVRDVNAVFGSDVSLNEEAVRVIRKSPKWTPAEQGGEKKSVKLSVPVVFEF